MNGDSEDFMRGMLRRIGLEDLSSADVALVRRQTEALDAALARIPRWRDKKLEPATIFVTAKTPSA